MLMAVSWVGPRVQQLLNLDLFFSSCDGYANSMPVFAYS